MRMNQLSRRALPITLIVVLLTLFVGSQPAIGDTGTTQGRATNVEGTVLGAGVSVTAVTLPANGAAVDGGAAINLGPSVGVPPLSTLEVGVSTGLVTSHCEGTPAGQSVSAHCYTRIDGLTVGASLNVLGVITTEPLVSTGVIDLHVLWR